MATRLLASKIKEDAKTCSSYYEAINITAANATTFCGEDDLTDPNTLKGYINATWYGSGSQYGIAMKTKLYDNATTYTNFYETDPEKAPGSFGVDLAATLTEIAR